MTQRTIPGPIGETYAQAQLARALLRQAENTDAVTLAQTTEKIQRWKNVLYNILHEQAAYGARAPFADVPVWVTPEVVTGGFATGNWLAGGDLQAHEQTLLRQLTLTPPPGGERLALNSYFLTDDGMARLQQRLALGTYAVRQPEEGALLTIAWLLGQHDYTAARALTETIAPWFAQLRFYPLPLEAPHPYHDNKIRLQNIADCVHDLRQITPNPHLLAQHEAVTVWAPLKDRIVALLLRAVGDGSLPPQITTDWQRQATTLLAEYHRLRHTHRHCGRPHKTKNHFSQLLRLLELCVNGTTLPQKQLMHLHTMLQQHIRKHGAPDSTQLQRQRAAQQQAVAFPRHDDLCRGLLLRLSRLPQKEGMDDVAQITAALSVEEAAACNVPPGSAIPAALIHKTMRCLNAPVSELIARRLITSAEALARVLPQISAGIHAAGFTDTTLRHLYTAVYSAFRQRRSLLLLNLQKQIQPEELPWIAAMEHHRQPQSSDAEVARTTLHTLCLLTVRSFPQTPLPNKLLQELGTLSRSAGLDVPWTEELAADIFMGDFSARFIDAVRQTALNLDNSLYARYYDIDCNGIAAALVLPPATDKTYRQRVQVIAGQLLTLCKTRADIDGDDHTRTFSPAINGRIIEQQQILCAHNLGSLFFTLELQAQLTPSLAQMCRDCLHWVCRRLQIPQADFHPALIALKQSACAWRQMVFYLSCLPADEAAQFSAAAETYLQRQPAAFRRRFAPIYDGLQVAMQGQTPDKAATDDSTTPQMFLGWAGQLWLLPLPGQAHAS